MMETQQSHTLQLPELKASTHFDAQTPEPIVVITDWIGEFNELLKNRTASQLHKLFRADSWLRDFLVLSWDFRTIHGLDNIVAYFTENLDKVQLRNLHVRATGVFKPCLKRPAPGVQWIEGMFDFETNVGRGSGVLRLVASSSHSWEAYLINFTLQELKGFEEGIHLKRPHGGNNSLLGEDVKSNWLERRARTVEFVDKDPEVLVIGAGQAGLDLGARLGRLGVSCLIIDRNHRVGDNWRSRYRTMVTHDPVHYCHMPYLPFPPNWPMFTPKDKLADWFEAYASIMELNIWTSTVLNRIDFDNTTGKWTADILRRDGSARTFYPSHVVLATGQAGEANIPTFPGQDIFKGTVYHASQHQDASQFEDVSGKKVVVVGSGTSGHDVSQNFCEYGAEVTMLQRKGTYVIGAEKGLFMLHRGTYEEFMAPNDEIDIYAQSLPIPIQFALNVYGTEEITTVEKDNLDALEGAGFNLDFGRDRSGIFRKYITRGGGYYIDVGCSQLIIDGKVKVKQSPGGITKFDKGGIVLADGERLEADIVVLATGYDNMRTTARKIMGNKIADQLYDVWDLNDEGEVKGIWRYSGHPGFWYMGGSLALCRSYSRLLALQIKASLENLYIPPQ